MGRLTTDQQLYARLTSEAKRWSKTFSLDGAASVVEETLQASLTA
jgi:16S rRNA U516 pseudouridylate synthase RsuA-like enzyme